MRKLEWRVLSTEDDGNVAYQNLYDIVNGQKSIAMKPRLGDFSNRLLTNRIALCNDDNDELIKFIFSVSVYIFISTPRT